jgi:Predicted membrane protein (DUF2207)
MTLAGADAPDSTYVSAWVGLGGVFLYYLAAAVLWRWVPRRSIPTAYEPPAGTSPALAAYLFENGRCERAFAAGLAALAVEGYLEIRQRGDWFTLKRLREPDDRLASEESTALAELFPYGNDIYKFDERENSRLCRAFYKFKDALEKIAEPKLVSSHRAIWWIGAACLVFLVQRVALSLSLATNLTALGSIVYVSIWCALGGLSLVAAVRAWPSTFKRIATWIPMTRGPRHPLSWIDMNPLWLTATAALAFGFLATTTSLRFAVFVVACTLLPLAFRNGLKAPTVQGRRLIRNLTGFREFLARAESDRLDRANEVGITPEQLDRYTPYAVALDVEHSWGEEFTEDLIEMIQFGRVMEIQDIPLPSYEGSDTEFGDSIIQLRLGPK